MLAQKGFENEMSYKYNFCLVYHKGNHFLIIIVLINVREHLRGNQKWTIQREGNKRYTKRRKTKHNI
jgi:hypothetical protein